MYLACGEGHPADRMTKRRRRQCGSWYSSRRASARSPDFSPPFAPAECWCARTMVASSMICAEISIGCQGLENTIPNALAGPPIKALGTHCSSVQMTDGDRAMARPSVTPKAAASTNRRLSSPWRPSAPSLPRTEFLNHYCHCALVSSRRIRNLASLGCDLEKSHCGVPENPLPNVNRS